MGRRLAAFLVGLIITIIIIIIITIIFIVSINTINIITNINIIIISIITSLTTNWLKCTVSNIFAWGKAASLLKFLKAAVMQNGAEEGLDLSDKFKSMLADLRTCTICGPLRRFHKSHGSTSKHKVRPLNAAEKEEEISWYRAIQADGDAARLKKLQEKRAVSRATQEAAQSAAAEGESPLTLTEDTGEYRFDFGK